MVWLMGWTNSRKLPPGLPNAMPNGRWPSLKMRVNSLVMSRLGVGDSLKNSRPVNHCWLIWPSQSELPMGIDAALQPQFGAEFQAGMGGRPPGEPRTMNTLSPKALRSVWEFVE